MKVNSEAEMLSFGRHLASKLSLPIAIELVGDVGVGKTTFTRGLANGLGIEEPVTSPSFTISKRYAFPIKRCKNYNNLSSTTAGLNSTETSSVTGELVHYDFYRLNDPGIMREELAETLNNPNNIVVVEWGEDVFGLLPEDHLRLEIRLNLDGSREVVMNHEDLLS